MARERGWTIVMGLSLGVMVAAALVWITAIVLAPGGRGQGWIIEGRPDGSHGLLTVWRSGWISFSRAWPLPRGARSPAAKRPIRKSLWAVPGLQDERSYQPAVQADGGWRWQLTLHSRRLHLGLPMLLGAVLPFTIWGRGRLKAHRAKAWTARGCCPACGYDLRGLPHERCPECGQGNRVCAPGSAQETMSY